jgi:hypothetical protein
MVKASERGTALVTLKRKDLDLVFSLQHERVVAKDNTVSFANRSWQLERSKLRGTLAGCRVLLHEHLDGTFTITFGPHVVGRYNEEAVEMTPPGKRQKQSLPAAAWKSQAKKQPDFPTFPQLPLGFIK